MTTQQVSFWQGMTTYLASHPITFIVAKEQKTMNQELNPDVANFIEAQKKVNEAQYRLHLAQRHLGDCSRALSTLYFDPISTLPATFVAHYDGQFFLIRIDTEGDHGHGVERIDGIMGQVGATAS